MSQSITESLLQAIKKDDIKAFNALTEKASGGVYRLGRFPVLSLLYLYKSRKILTQYESRLIKITTYEQLTEPVEVSQKFSSKAGKCLRLYFNEIVSPLEMLLILNKTGRLKRVYPLAKPSQKVKERLKAIYIIRYSLEIKFEGDNVIIPKRPLSYREKKNIALGCLCSALALTLAVGVPVATISLIPKPVKGEVTNLSQIDFSSKDEYTLRRDIVVPENYSVKQFNCNINGGGHKLIFGKGATLGEFNGTMSDLTIESSGNAMFTFISENATVKSVTVNVNADVVSKTATALISQTNYGTIDGVTLNVSGKLTAIAKGNDDVEELAFGGLVANNSYIVDVETQTVYTGLIKNCTVNYTNFALEGETGANAMFGGVAGINGGYLQDCTVTGEIIADTFDVAGVCSLNNGMVTNNVNAANLSQTASDENWNPIVSGIAIRNYYIIQNCENKGRISSISTAQSTEEEKELTVTAAGIVYLNGIEGVIELSVNSGSITAKGNFAAYAGGICASLYSRIANCISSGEITVTANKIYAGGIYASGEVTSYGPTIYFGVAERCVSSNVITVEALGKETAFVGGIAGKIAEFQVNETLYVGGGAKDCYFTGGCKANANYFGAIVGVCAEYIYKTNSYQSGATEYHNFEGNYYSDNSQSAFGATVTEEGEYAEAADKGATCKPLEEIINLQGYKDIISATPPQYSPKFNKI